jgi:hypothetical protein
MTPNKQSRGRPKGTGLNDAAQLKAIADLMATHPEMKPTTAIKALGISDPSVIRRLRDKFQATEAQLLAELKGTAVPPAEAAGRALEPLPHPSFAAAPTAARVVPLAGAREGKRTAPVARVAPAPAQSATIETLRRPARVRLVPNPSETELPTWMGVGLSLYVLSLETQFAVAGTMFEWPPLAAVLRSQVAFTEVAIAMTRPTWAASLSDA